MQRYFLLAAILLLPVWGPGEARGQSEDESLSPDVCLAGRPASQCGWFAISNLEIQQRAAGSTFVEGVGGGVVESPALDSHWAWSVGAMKNLDDRNALGAAVILGRGGDGARLGAEGRYRYWLGTGTGLDLSAGIIRAYAYTPRGDPSLGPSHTAGWGVTAGASLGLTDWAALTGRADVVWAGDDRSNAVYGGVRLGTVPGLILSAVVLTLTGLTST